MFALGVYILIHNIGLFTNIALNGALTLTNRRYSPGSTIVQVDVDLMIQPQLNRAIGLTFRPRPSCCQPIWSLL